MAIKKEDLYKIDEEILAEHGLPVPDTSSQNLVSLYLYKQYGSTDWTRTTVASYTDLNHLAHLLTKFAYGPGVFRQNGANECHVHGWRKNENLARVQSILVFDLDNDPAKVKKALTLKAAIGRLKKAGLKFIILPTRNHQKVKHPGEANEQPAVDRYRIILFLHTPIYSPAAYKATFKYYASLLKLPYDTAACHSACYFHPSPSVEPGLIWEEGAYISEQEPAAPAYDNRNLIMAPSTGEKGCLSARSKYFLTAGSVDKSLLWHIERNFLIADCRSQNFSFEETEGLLLTVTGHLTDEDRYQLKDIFYKRLNFRMDFRKKCSHGGLKNEH